MKRFAPAILLVLITGFLLASAIRHKPPEPAGDICEYYGMTHTIRERASLILTEPDIRTLERELGRPYYRLWYCYMTGKSQARYPLHFFAYSASVVPVRALMDILHLSPWYTFIVANILWFFLIMLAILRWIPLSTHQSTALILLTITSPLLSFFSWPGPDLVVMILVLFAGLFIMRNRYTPALFLLAIASWQSQPVIAALGIISFGAVFHSRSYIRTVLTAVGVALVPYVYNLYAFGILTPWQTLPDGWTQTVGFGLHNIGIQKLLEQWFDLNIGVFWYAPALFVFSAYTLIKTNPQNKQHLVLFTALVATLLAFQTNPAWHYGTAGFGPGRHSLIIIPFLIAAITPMIHWSKQTMINICLVIVVQLFVLSGNHMLFPTFTDSLTHSPIARTVLNTWPNLYSPTPEIFVDRTTHSDEDHITSAFYTQNGTCKKAYILPEDIDLAIETCGALPQHTKASIYNITTDGWYITY